VKITPLEINKQEFKKTMRGYDPVEVDTFLEMIGNEYEKVLADNKESQRRIIELETELRNFKEVEKTLKQTLMNMQESSNQSRENIRKEADLTRREAEIAAAEVLDKARGEAQKIKDEVATFQSQKYSLVSRLRHILTSQLELLELLDVDDLDTSKLKDRTQKVFSAAPKTKNVAPQSKEEPAAPAQKREPEKPEKPAGSDDNLHGADLFKDIFGDDLNEDQVI
jgi:cell division initiation protein